MLVSILIYFAISFIPDVRFLLEVVHCFKFFIYFCRKFQHTGINVELCKFASKTESPPFLFGLSTIIEKLANLITQNFCIKEPGQREGEGEEREEGSDQNWAGIRTPD
jgi:hypothetical protein